MNADERNLVWHERAVEKADYRRRNGHRSLLFWFTGLSGSGKSTLAHAVEEALFEQGVYTYLLDGDNIRHGLNRDLGFSPADREENIRRIGEVARLFADAGVVTMTSFISPYRKDRQQARDLHDAAGVPFVEVFVDTPVDVCEKRDPKGLYRKARLGEIRHFTGVDDPYETPDRAELVVKTAERPPAEIAAQVLDYLLERGILHAPRKD
jgi:adenylylsulfate kinase